MSAKKQPVNDVEKPAEHIEPVEKETTIPAIPKISKYLVSAKDKKGSSVLVKALDTDEALSVWAKRFGREISEATAINITDRKKV